MADRSDFTKLAIIAAGNYFTLLQKRMRLVKTRTGHRFIEDISMLSEEDIEDMMHDFADWLKDQRLT